MPPPAEGLAVRAVWLITGQITAPSARQGMTLSKAA